MNNESLNRKISIINYIIEKFSKDLFLTPDELISPDEECDLKELIAYLESQRLRPMSEAPRDRKIRIDTGDGNILVMEYDSYLMGWWCYQKIMGNTWVQTRNIEEIPHWRGWYEMEGDNG